MEPVTLITGAAIALAGIGVGRLTGRRSRTRFEPPHICRGCEHGFSYHDDDGKCHGTEDKTSYSGTGGPIGSRDVPCTCQRYDGEVPADRVVANYTAFPSRPSDKP